MPSLKGLFSSSSLFSSPSSPCDSRLRSEPGSKKRLTRQRRLRHLTEVYLGLSQTDHSRSLPVSPDSGPRSPPNLCHWSPAAIPQPLPLPEFTATLIKQNDQQNWKLPTRGDGRDATGCSNLLSSTPGSSLSHQITRKTTEHAATNSSKIPTYRRRGFRQHLNVKSVHHTLKPNDPPRSAPTTGFSSPALSPQRFSTMDLGHSSFVNSLEFRGPSSPQGPLSDKLAPCTPDHSPVHSPEFRCAFQTKTPSGVPFHSHHKSLTESSMVLREGCSHANLHPLPLPPGGPKPSQSATNGYVLGKPDMSLMKGQWVKGKLIGRGTYGSVYEAVNRETGALCAMKEVDVIGDDPKSAECISQLEQEIKVLQHLKHANIVQYYGCEMVKDHFCIYLEFVHPGSINKYVREHYGAVTECVVRNFTRHILSGLAYLHGTKTIHRDIKGANLLVDASGVVKLADFGLAKHLTGAAIDLSLKGSPHWMAPEVLQAVMRKDSNPQLAYAVDIWSVGCTVIEMLDGKPPWSEFNGVQAMFNVLNKSPPIPETLSSQGKDFLRRCFQRNPADRPSAARLLDHPFLRSSNDQDFLGCMKEYSRMKLIDHSPRDGTRSMVVSLPTSPGSRSSTQLPSNGGTSPKPYPECSETGVASSHQSPRSTLEALPTIPSPELNCRSQNAHNSLQLPAPPKTAAYRKEIPHL